MRKKTDVYFLSLNMHTENKFSIGTSVSVSGNVPVVYAPRMKVIHVFGGTLPVTEKVIYTFLYYYVIDNRRYTLCSEKKNTHSRFLSYLRGKCLDLHKIFRICL